jgi:steroid 5-alpha reductase family enzyme
MTVPALVAIVTTAAAVAWAASDGGSRFADVPVVWWCAAFAFVVQWIAFVPASRHRTERFYDLTGSVTYLLVVWSALILTAEYDPRSLLLATLVSVWTLRLGLFLFRRIQADGGDSRFDEIKTEPGRFLVAWTLQGLWVFLTASAALAAITAGYDVRLGALDGIGAAIWAIGFGIESIADSQKRRFRGDPDNEGRFISEGLWSWSRHPNYFGEIVLWIGVAVIAASTLEGWRWVTLVSPLFVIVLLTRISGIPLLERRADKRWGGEESYERYKARTSVLIPVPPGD